MVRMIEQTCQQCGKLFLAMPYKVKVGNAKFCSRQCHYKHTTRVKRICQHCENVFYISRADITRGRGQFCSRFCSAQHRVGIPLSSEAKNKISKANSTKTRPDELRQQISTTLKAKYANGYIHPMLGKKHTAKSRAKMSLSQKGRHHQHSKKFKARISEFMKDKWQDLDYRKKILEVLTENKKMVSGRMRRLWQDPTYRQGLIGKIKQHYNNPDVRQQISERSRTNWQNPDYVSITLRARGLKPTKPEKQLGAILDRYFPDFEYNGDGRLGVTLGGLTPDFVNVNGKKDLIEVFGDYYHSPRVIGNDWRRSELGKVMLYNSLGWKCLIIWQHEIKELSEREIVDKIKTFFTPPTRVLTRQKIIQ